jgi:hypothetical protein
MGTRTAFAVGIASVLLAASLTLARAATLVVSNSSDVVNGDTSTPQTLINNPGPDGISLREALTAANNVPGPHTISFDAGLAGQTITLTNHFAAITRDDITLRGVIGNDGQPDIAIDGNNVFNGGPLLFVAASSFQMSGIRLTNIHQGLTGVQIGGSSYNDQGHLVDSPKRISNFRIVGNAFSNGLNSNAFAICVCHTANITSDATISNVVIGNNNFDQVFESVNVGTGGSNNTIKDVVIYGNTFTANTATGTSAVEVGNSIGTNNRIQDIQILQNSFVGNFQGAVLNNNSTSSGNVIDNTLIARNVFSGNLQALGIAAGVDPTSSNGTISNTQIINNVVELLGWQGNGSATIQITDSQNGGANNKVQGVTFAHNTIYNNGSGGPPGAGVWVTSHGAVTGIAISNSIFWGMIGDTFNGVAPGDVSHSVVNQTGFTGVNHNIAGDPLFANAAQSDFHLQAGSPARTAGANNGVTAIDLDCQPRGVKPAMGAYELSGPDVCATSPPLPLTASHAFDGNTQSDVLLRLGSTGAVTAWLMNGAQIGQSKKIGSMSANWQVVAQRDFDADGRADILWRNSDTGALRLWLMNGTQLKQTGALGKLVAPQELVGVSDFNHDGTADLLVRDNATGRLWVWLTNGAMVVKRGLLRKLPCACTLLGTGPAGEILWRKTGNGAVVVWQVDGFAVTRTFTLQASTGIWEVLGWGDFDANGTLDLLWRDSSTGNVRLWLLDDGHLLQSKIIGPLPADTSIALTGDFDGDGKTDLLLTTSAGHRTIWFMNGTTVRSKTAIADRLPNWTVQGVGAE